MKNILLLFFSFFFFYATAQVGERFTEEDINTQAQIVKATQKKLIRKYDDAIEIYENILEKDRHNKVALFELSRIYMIQDIEDKAIEFGEKALKKEPENAWFKESLAEIKMKFKHYREAAELYQELAVNAENDQSKYLKAVEAYRNADDEMSTLQVFEKMEMAFGKNSYISQQIIGIHLKQENYQAAIAKAKQLARLYKDDSEYLQLYAELEADFGSKKEAEKIYNQIIKLDPENSKALVFLAQKKGSSNDLASLKTIVSNANVDIDVKVKALIPYAEKITKESPNKLEVIGIAEKIVALHPEEAKGYALLADFHNNSGNPEEAEKNYMSALKLDKSVYAIWEQLMFIQYDLGHFSELLLTSNNALDFYPNQAAPYTFLGLANANMGDYDESKSMMEEANLIGTKNPIIKSLIDILSMTIRIHEEGDVLKVMSKEDLFMRGLKEGDPSIIQKRVDGKYLVRVKKGS